MAIGPYIEIARIDHWFKNAFMLLGLVVAVFFGDLPYRIEQLRSQ
jgi:hypothetical protein